MSPEFRVVLEGRIVADYVLTAEASAGEAEARVIRVARSALENVAVHLVDVRATDVQRIDKEPKIAVKS